MENDILTGKKINEAKNSTTDDEVNAILKSAQEQLDKDMGYTARLDREKIDRELAAKEKAEKDRHAKEKAAKEKAEKDRLAKEKAAKEKAEKDRLAKEKAAKEKAEKDRLAREQEAKERLAREKNEKEQKAQEKLQQMEKERLVKEKADLERFAKEWNEQEMAEKQKKALEELEKTMPNKMAASNTKKLPDKSEIDELRGKRNRVDIRVDDAKHEAGEKKVSSGFMPIGDMDKKDKAGDGKTAEKEAAATMELADNVFIDDDIKPPIEKKLGLTVGDVIGGILEFIWFAFKMTVLISIVTAVVGFFLSREMLIRGRNGNLYSLDSMKASSIVISTKESQDIDVNGWLKTVKREKLTMESDDGLILVARKIVQKKDSGKWVVLLHGYNGSMQDVYDIAMHYYNEEYNILMPDLRACGESEGSFIGMGWLDRLDVINWIDVILDEDPTANIAIHGVDMGADTALMLSGEPIKDNIMVIVADGAYTSAWDVLKGEFKLRHEKWPVFPLMNMVNPVAKFWGGYSLKEASAVSQVAKTHVPILYIHGGQDTYVTSQMADTLNDTTASSHKLVTIMSGMHEDCRYVDPTSYYNATFDFVNAHIIK